MYTRQYHDVKHLHKIWRRQFGPFWMEEPICIYNKQADFNIQRRRQRWYLMMIIIEPHHEKTCLWGFRPGKTQTGLCSHKSRQMLEISGIIPYMWTLPDHQGGSLKWALKFLLKCSTFYQNFKISLIWIKNFSILYNFEKPLKWKENLPDALL